jgi:hypothetical protein
MGFIQTYQKTRGRSPYAHSKTDFLMVRAWASHLGNHRDGTAESVVSITVLSNHAKKML